MSVVCLVPTILRASRAARRLCDAENGILFGARVTTIDALAPGLLASTGDRRPVLSVLAEGLLALEAGEAAGGLFAGLSPGSGLARALASALRELREGELGVQEVRDAASELGGRAGERLSCLASALEAYLARLSELDVLDRPACQRAVAQALLRGGRAVVPVEELRDLDLLLLDGFTGLPPPAFDLVAALANRARRTHVRVPFFPERPDVCAPAEPLLRRLEALHELSARREVTLALEDLDAGGERAAGLARVLRAVAGGAGGSSGEAADGRVLAAVGAGEEGEAEVAAGAMARWLERGLRPEDVIAFAPSIAAAAPRLARACAALGVPFAAGRGESLSELPPVRALRDALEAAVKPGRDALEAVIHSPYLEPTRATARLSHWLDRAGAIEGRCDPEHALRRRAEALRSPASARERAACLRSADSLAELRSSLHGLASPGRPREHAARSRALLTGADSRRRACRAEIALARRDLAALTRFEEISDGLAQALAVLGRGDETLPAERWIALLDLALRDATLPPTSEPAAGAVELWPLSEAPGLGAHAAVLVGCAQGSFPSSPAPEPLLRDAERAALNRSAWRASAFPLPPEGGGSRRGAVASGPMLRGRALHAAFCALAAGRQALALTWPGGGPEGAGSSPAPLAVEALLVAGVEVPAAADLEPSLSERRSEAGALRAAARAAARGEDAPSCAAALPPALAGRLGSALARGAIEAERRRAVIARCASPAAGGLPPELVPELLRALPDEWSPSQLEMHARCPYRLFAGLVLGLPDPEAADLDIDPRDEGRLAHAVLERFLRGRLARSALPLRGTPEERSELRVVAGEVFALYEADGRTGDPATWPGRSATVLARLELVVDAEGGAGSTQADELGGLVPALLEYQFGGDSGVPPLAFPDPLAGSGEEREVLLRGRIDRVDASTQRMVVIDYKDSRARSDWRKKLEREALGQTNFQAPAYLMAASRALPGRVALEATYLLLRSAERVEPFRCETGDPLLAVDEAGRALAREAGDVPFADAVVSAVRRIRAGDFPIVSRDCTGCAFGAVCRAQSLAEVVP